MRFFLFRSGYRSQGSFDSVPTKRKRNIKQGRPTYLALVNYARYVYCNKNTNGDSEHCKSQG